MKKILYLKVNKYLIFVLVNNNLKYDANEKYLAAQNFNSKNKIYIYEIPKEINDADIANKKHGRLYCTIKSKIIIDFILNPNYLNILLVVNYKQILFFIIPDIFQEELITTPRFTFNANNINLTSAKFNPVNSHIIASSCEDDFLNFLIRILF